MKMTNTQRKQRGFFDLGLGLGLVLLFGGTAAVIAPDNSDEIAQEENKVIIESTRLVKNEEE